MVKIISDIGYCSGVKQAINKLEKVSRESNEVFLLHPILHNIKENDFLMKKNNAKYLDESSTIEKNSTLLFSAHGYKFNDFKNYKSKMNVVIGTCPIILNRYKLLEKYNKSYFYVFLGKGSHEETKSFIANFSFLHLIDSNKNIQNQIKNMDIKNKNIFFIPQTTISNEVKDECLSILEINNNIVKRLDICQIYHKRITQIDKFLSRINKMFILIIVGDKLSSNANEIYNFVKKKYSNSEVYIENKFDMIKKIDLKNKDIYLTSATSSSEECVKEIKGQIDNYLLSLI